MSCLGRLEAALAISVVESVPRSYAPAFLRAADWPSAPVIPPSGDPYDERGRFDLKHFPNYVDTRICLRLDLQHPSVPPDLARRITETRYPDVGEDGALYFYEGSTRSQHQNAVLARARLQELIESMN